MALSCGTVPGTGTGDSPDSRPRPLGPQGVRFLRERLSGSGGSGVVGLAAVALLVAAQRWGSYLGVPHRHLFLTDLLLVAAILRYLIRRRGSGLREDLTGATMVRGGGLAVGGLLAVGVFRYLAGADHGATALRDAAPFLYAVLAFLVAGSVALAPPRARELARKVVVGALLVHLLLVIVALLRPEQVAMLPRVSPGAPVRYLELRSDVDGALLAVLAAWGLFRMWRERARAWLWLGVVVASVLALLQLPSRVGPLAAVACLVLAGLAAGRSAVRVRDRLARSAALVAVVVGLALILPTSLAGTRLIGSVLPVDMSSWTGGTRPAASSGSESSGSESNGSASSGSASSGSAGTPVPAPSEPGTAASGASQPEHPSQVVWHPRGTTHARWKTWRAVLRYYADTPARVLFGVGFGPNVVDEAGATALIGESRSPHNFLLTVLARTGLLGMLVLAGFVVLLVGAAARALRGGDQLSVLSVLLIVGLSIGGMVGVVLESPFGIIPVYWATGVLLARGDLQVQ